MKDTNGYTLLAYSYSKLLKQGGLSAEEEKELREKIDIYEFLSKISESGKYILFDSSMFNDILKGYVNTIMDDLTNSEDKEIRSAAKLLSPIVKNNVTTVLEHFSSKAAETYYREK